MLWGLSALAYLLGSVSSAIIVCRLMGLGDPREAGSGNPGATNVLRIGGERGKLAAAITLLGDLLKGLVAVLAARWAGLEGWQLGVVGFAAFLGHLYPLFFGFRGGKGVATFLGVLFGLNPLMGLAFAVIWLFVAKVLKISSAAALAASALSPLYVWWLSGQDQALTAVITLMAVLLWWRHRSNIVRLLRGEEKAPTQSR
ncbi:acyl-phosphate glycerol-3-phosphate acyltransferase [Sulfurivirga caldicuralii]|uniref:Glycerol-3-phosphate acyltransferase n=2 Tax=Sulfurivirga caldicuralii TaxID=364032 RepID=A0A1N6GRZ9_9GAMM|nr:acyl-phosphate glycerol-3-phosphate acyltransferase [Sulfurivirga caldicuralii]